MTKTPTFEHRPGLRFQKLDLHLHTPASRCFGDKTVTPQAIIEAALKKGLAGIAITDHNSGEWIDAVKEAAGGRIAVIPGVEITCQGGSGIHVVALFEIASGTKEINAFLNTIGIMPKDYGQIQAIAPHPPQYVIERIHSTGGIGVLAHANSSNGVFKEMRGQSRLLVVSCPQLHAVEATDFQDAAKAETRKRLVDFLDGTDAEYKRKLAVYQASDNPCGDSSGDHGLAGIGTRCSFFKLETVDLEGLRQCFLDPDVRIRQDFEYQLARYPYIRSITVHGGYLDEVSIAFHPGLNSVLGGKGTGKSLLVELLRFALDQSPSDKAIREDHDSKLARRFEEHSYVELAVAEGTGEEWAIRRTYLPTEENPYGSDEERFRAQAFPVLFLSQNEIIKITENDAAQLAFIDRFLDFRTHGAKVTELQARLGTSDRRMAESMRAGKTEAALKVQAGQLAKELERLDGSLKNPAFEKYSAAEAKRFAFLGYSQYVKGLLDVLDAAEEMLLEGDRPAQPPALAEDPALKRCQTLIDGVPVEVQKSVEELREYLRSARRKIEEASAAWEPKRKEIDTEYQAVVTATGGGYKELADERRKKLAERERVKSRLLQLGDVAAAIKRFRDERDQLLEELGEVEGEYSKRRREQCAAMEAQAAGRLRVSIQATRNTDGFLARLEALRKGSGARATDLEGIATRVLPKDFIYGLLQCASKLTEDTLKALADPTGVPVERMRPLVEHLLAEVPYEQLLELQHTATPQDRPEILYDVGGGKYEPLSQVSTGQKAVALLIMALSEDRMPIVIDQPEDSLDLRSVWEDICLKLRRGKERRQFIFTTHNASLAVASDTDSYVVLEGDANHGKVASTGSMDGAPMDAHVLDHLEGGMETYRRKYWKYRGDRRVQEG